MEEILLIFRTIISEQITLFFSALIVGWLIIAIIIVVARSRNFNFGGKLVAITPNSLATLGVLGTFTGILIGLLDFDVLRIDESVPSLLAGLKIAFATSIVGIAAAIIFRFIHALAPSGTTSGEVTPEDIHEALINIRDENKASNTRSAEQLLELRNAISSEGDSSLLTQVQKLRTTLQDGQNELIGEFRDFAKHMVENNQKAIIEALKEVISDFNQKLTEQFGDNFKQLNEAVRSLVEWQDKYREHVEALEQRLETAVSAVEATQKALESVQSHSERIPETIKLLEPALTGINAQTEVMGGHLDAIAGLRDKAIEAFPVIEGNLQKVTDEFATGIEHVIARSREALAEGEKAHTELRKGYEAFLKDAGEARERFSTELTDALKQMSVQSSQEFERHGKLIKAASDEAQKAITDNWAQSLERTNKQFEEFDKQMEQELQRTMELFGKNLAAVSEKFVTDYTPLTERLRELVNISKGAN